MQGLLLILAIIGFIGAARLAGRAAFRVLFRGVEGFLAGEAGDTHARRGDITALRTAEAVRSTAKRARLASTALLAAWIGLLVIPTFTPWPRLIYAAYLPLWLVHRRKRA